MFGESTYLYTSTPPNFSAWKASTGAVISITFWVNIHFLFPVYQRVQCAWLDSSQTLHQTLSSDHNASIWHLYKALSLCSSSSASDMLDTGPPPVVSPVPPFWACFRGARALRTGFRGLSVPSFSKLISRTTSGLAIFERDLDLASWALLSAAKCERSKISLSPVAGHWCTFPRYGISWPQLIFLSQYVPVLQGNSCLGWHEKIPMC